MGFLLRQLWLIPVLFAVLVAAVGWSSYRSLERATKNGLAEELFTLLSAELTALRIWVDTQKDIADAAARDPVIRASTNALLRRARAGGDPVELLLAGPERAELDRALASISESHGYSGYAVVDPYGLWIASSTQELVGMRRAPIRLARAHQGETTLSHPVELEEGITRGGQISAPVLVLSAPVLGDDGQVIAAVTFALDADKQFSEILWVARKGVSGETYAFDKTGAMLSESRFNSQLAEIGLLSDSQAGSAMRIQIRDPGGNLAEGHEPDLPLKARSLTFMAADSISGNTGFNVEGYRGYRGVPVIGAWTWLEELDLGIATEIDAAEAYTGLVAMRKRFATILGLLVVSALAMLLYSAVLARMRSQVDRAQQLGRYRIEDKIGEGGMGKVYRARHSLLRRPTAIKLLSAEDAKSESAVRFEREVQATAALTHPNTIAIFDYGHTPEGVFYYAMEYLDGVTLSNCVKETGPMPEARVVHIMKQACGSIAEAHDQGLIHRDIKPQNIMICERGGMNDFVKVLDFGLVRQQNSDLSLTNVGALTGTPLYLSPEALEAPETMDARSDLYQLGAVAYFLLTGRPVFSGNTLVEVLSQHLHKTPETPSSVLGRDVAQDLEAVVLRCLAKDREQRYANARELLAALEACECSLSWTRDDADEWWKEWRASRPAISMEPKGERSDPSAYEIDLAERS